MCSFRNRAATVLNSADSTVVIDGVVPVNSSYERLLLVLKEEDEPDTDNVSSSPTPVVLFVDNNL